MRTDKSSPEAIALSINGYRHFVEAFRRNCTRGAGEFDVSSLVNKGAGRVRFRPTTGTGP